MKPQTNVIIYRTQNDTDVLSFVLKVRTDDGIENVSDDDEVSLHVETSDGIIEITGTPKGDASGTFYFNPATIKQFAETMRFELQVTRDSDGIIYTAATGTLVSTEELG